MPSEEAARGEVLRGQLAVSLAIAMALSLPVCTPSSTSAFNSFVNVTWTAAGTRHRRMVVYTATMHVPRCPGAIEPTDGLHGCSCGTASVWIVGWVGAWTPL